MVVGITLANHFLFSKQTNSSAGRIKRSPAKAAANPMQAKVAKSLIIGRLLVAQEPKPDMIIIVVITNAFPTVVKLHLTAL